MIGIVCLCEFRKRFACHAVIKAVEPCDYGVGLGNEGSLCRRVSSGRFPVGLTDFQGLEDCQSDNRIQFVRAEIPSSLYGLWQLVGKGNHG